MIRRLFPILAASALLLAACGFTAAPTPPPLDANQIITKGFEATSKLKSFHMTIALDGNATIPQVGGNLALKGTELTGDFDVAKKQAHATFSVPALLSLSGEVVANENATYLKTSLTGTKWKKQDNGAAGSIPDVQDPTKALADIKKFMDKDGVEAKKLDDAKCGDSTCYRVELTIPSALLDDAAAAAGSSPSEVLGQALVVDLEFDRQTMFLSSVATNIDAKQIGSVDATITLSAFDQPVTITEPPASDVDTSGGGFSFP